MPLVESLPAKNPGSSPAEPDATEVLWSGTDPGFAGSLADALDRAEIEHSDDSVELSFLRAFPSAVYKLSVRPVDRDAADRVLQDLVDGMGAEVPTTPAELARAAVTANPYRGLDRRVSVGERVNRFSSFENPLSLTGTGLKRSAGGQTLPSEDAELVDPESLDVLTPDDVVKDFDPGRATCEVWAGEAKKMAEYLGDCLRGVGIGFVLSRDGNTMRVCVLPAAEGRAREIIREIVEASPPE
ncbi:MAG TPA: hypothetical protein VJO53_04140 [Candidatus Acidoferrales bacterium]|nr:hypothetical protein [Candidatus Acidoferrales bacterium]